jgi:hypothetical protein
LRFGALPFIDVALDSRSRDKFIRTPRAEQRQRQYRAYIKELLSNLRARSGGRWANNVAVTFE